ncbi:MAG: major facilitator superfamily domain-containing protein [Benjaminiella poitrasii]|nr:MAG: major facilitator superfamily domain-containing protein [Benjaminiella poitrasii]
MTITDPPLADKTELYINESSTATANVDSEIDTIVNKLPTQTSIEQTECKEDAGVVVVLEEENKITEYSIKEKLSRKRKWFILSIVALQGFLGPLTSSIYVPAISQVKHSFRTTSTAINATISLYVFIMGFAPLLWASLSERQGRRTVYLSAIFVYFMTTIGCALAQSIELFTALRAFQSVGASASQAVGAGTITDLFDVHQRGNAMGLFLLGPLVGPVVGPIAGGFINEYLDWRYIFWLLSGMGGLIFILVLFFVPETSAIILMKRSEFKVAHPNSRKQYILARIFGFEHEESIWKSMLRPFKFILLPAVILSTTPYSIAYGFMYFVIASLPHQLSYHYHYTSYQIGLAYLANGLGNAIGAFISGKWADRALNKIAVENKDKKKHLEVRLTPMWLGIILLPAGELIYGWCVHRSLNVFAGFTGLFLLGLGVGMVQTPCNTYIVDLYQNHSASAMSAGNLLRCISAGCTPLVAPTLIAKIGNDWSMTILAIISLMSGVCIFVVQRYGQSWQQKSNSRLN